MITDLSKVRNIGISAHIDSGKTTLTERILFYTNRIHAIHEVRGKDGVGAKMDSMELERERGITIQSAATYTSWKDCHINIIDTPGHVDFTIEVERALRVLDGAILVLCGVAGVQSQSITVDRQMRRYGVPRVAFVNKLDRQGANPVRVRNQLREKLRLNAHLVQLPIGLEDRLEGCVDLVSQRAFYFDGDSGESIREEDIPADMVDDVATFREELLDAVSEYDDDLMETLLEDPDSVNEEQIRAAIRKGTIDNELVPVFMGSAYKNKGVQLLLDGVNNYLPDPSEVLNEAFDLDTDEENPEKFPITPDPDKPFVGLAFKLEEGRYGQLTYVRVYQGTLRKGEFIFNMRGNQKVKVGRLVRMHSDEMEDIEEAPAGDIVALFGVDCHSGDTFTDGKVRVSMTNIHVPDAVIDYTINAESKYSQNLSKALARFAKEDPTFRVRTDPETGETIISGMGELHLDVYLERMRREYKVPVESSPPRVAYRETINQRATFDYTHKKQTGGSGQFGRVAGAMEPLEEGHYEFVDQIVGGAIPREYIPSVDKGFQQMMDKGQLIGAPVTGVKMTINDGKSHAVDSSDMAFQAAGRGAFRDVYGRAKPVILEPIMKVVVEGPAEFHGGIVGTVMGRRGVIMGTSEEDNYSVVEAEVPLAEMFGYSTALRSSTQGKAEFSMEFEKYGKVPDSVAQELIEAYKKEQEEKKK